jgi:hypothetical protein
VSRIGYRIWAEAASLWDVRIGKRRRMKTSRKDTYKRVAGGQWLQAVKTGANVVGTIFVKPVSRTLLTQGTVATPVYLVIQVPSYQTEVYIPSSISTISLGIADIVIKTSNSPLFHRGQLPLRD